MVISLGTARSFSARLELARNRTDELFGLLRGDALYERPIAERHRLIFYLGHLEAFDWNLIGRGALELPSFHAGFDNLFAFGIDPPPGKAPEDRPSDWPSEEEANRYRARVRRTIDERLADVPEQLLHIAIEHRLMHAETFAYLLHNLPYDLKLAGLSAPVPATAPARPETIGIPAGRATLGQEAGEFGWDNEFEKWIADVPEFAIGKYKVTNREYLKFVGSGAAAPHFWMERNGEWYYRGMFAETALPLDAPVYVTHDEASAYARWAGQELPTESQFHRAAYGAPGTAERQYPWGDDAPQPHHGNFDSQYWDPIPVNATPAGDSAFGVSQAVGNGWEWTSTRFGPFPGFEPFSFYPGYSKDFFDGEHFVLKGASPRTAACFARRSFRNWFRPNYPYVYATFRLVEN
jgi:iron(II)-dependent oxidoreductase